MDENNKLQNSYVYIVLGLILISFIAAVAIAVCCYTPYSFRSGISAGVKGALWTVMILPSVMLPLSLWLSNMLSPKLSRYSLLLVLLCFCYFAVIPKLYTLFEPAETAISSSALVFFFTACCFSAVIKDLKKAKTKRWINITLGIILTVGLILLSGYAGYFIIGELHFLDRLAICMVAPLLCLVYALGALTDIYALGTVILSTVAVGYATLCAAFDVMNKRPLFCILLGLLALTVIWQISDIIKYIRSKENDSKSCNA